MMCAAPCFERKGSGFLKKNNPMEREEKMEGGKIAIKNPVFKWLDNFWYHYKWTVLIVAFFVITFAFCFSQCTQRRVSDSYITFVGGYTPQLEEIAAIEQIFYQIHQQTDVQKATSVGFSSYPFYTEGELKALYTNPETGEVDTYGFALAKQSNKDRYDSFSSYMMTGECSIWLVSNYIYENKFRESMAVELSKNFDVLPSSAYDEYAIRLGDTELYQYYDALQVLPEDTLIVLSPAFAVYGAASNEARYKAVVELYRSIVNFQAP